MYQYTAHITDVHDGDTFTAVVDLGFCVSAKQKFRLLGIQAPELSHPDGVAAREYLSRLIAGKTLALTTAKDRREKYGRYLASIIVDGVSVSKRLIEAGLGVEWDGKGPKPEG